MCEPHLSNKLPKVPGYSIPDLTKKKFHKINNLEYKNGVPSPKIYAPGELNSLDYFDYEPPNTRLDPLLIYGEPKKQPPPPFRPHYVRYDRTCLRFRGYFRQPAFHTPDEAIRIRLVDVLYFLDDDTVTVIEPTVPNSGLPQGRLVRRSRVPMGPLPDCDYLHWKDLNLKKEIHLCGFSIRLVDCDPFTHEFLLSQGVEINPPEEIPPDEYTLRQGILAKSGVTGCHSHTLSSADLKLKNFYKYDGIVFRFGAVWDTRDIERDGDINSFCVAYYLVDETIQITRIFEKNSGMDPFSVLLKKTQLPKQWDRVPVTYPSETPEIVGEVTEFYKPQDLKVGETLDVFGRKMLLHKCDDFTRQYYQNHYNITQSDNFEVKQPPPPPAPRVLPPYTGYGELEDSLQSCLKFIMRSPRKDVVREIVNANHFLRYQAKLETTHPEDKIRRFVISYSLADGTINISEPPIRNSGHVGGRFLSPMLIAKPGSNPDYPTYYTPQDFFVGAIVEVNKFRFIITGADLHVYTYMKANLEKFRPEVFESIRSKLLMAGLIKPEDTASLNKEEVCS